jgi:hypothetical protein
VLERDDLAARRRELELLAVQVALRLVEEALRLPEVARDAGEREPGALPELVVVDLGDGGAEAVLELPDRATTAEI